VAILAYLGNLASHPPAERPSNIGFVLMCFAAGLFGTILAFIFSYLTQLRLFHEERCRHRHERVYDRHWIFLVVAFGSGSFRYRMLERLFSLHLVRVSMEDRRASLIGHSRGCPLFGGLHRLAVDNSSARLPIAAMGFPHIAAQSVVYLVPCPQEPPASKVIVDRLVRRKSFGSRRHRQPLCRT
jgi:hypothetical protein